MTKSRFKQIIAGRFFWLLVAIVAAILIAGCAPGGNVGRWVAGLPVVGVLVAATYAARGGRTRLLVTLILNGVLVVVGAIYVSYRTPLTQNVFFGILLVSLLFTLISTLSFVLTNGTVQPDHIYGAICAYMLVAMVFATVYTMQELANPRAFNGLNIQDPDDRPWDDMLYFSFTTLSTVGYGDITPVRQSARSVCCLEMVTGTFYVAILIARLAGLYPPPSPKD